MKMLIYGILIAAALAVPTRTLELGKLKPVEVIRIEKTGEMIRIETDTGDSGEGGTVNQAIWDLQETTAGRVYLDTAEYILLGADETVLNQISPYLKDAIRVCKCAGEIKLDETAVFLDVHRPKIKLKDYQKGMELQVLEEENGVLRLREKNIERREKTS